MVYNLKSSPPFLFIEMMMQKTKVGISAQKILDKFLRETGSKNIFRMSFEFIPLFWTIPVFYFNEKLEAVFTPTLAVKNRSESYLFINSDYIFGYPEKVLRAYLLNESGNQILSLIEKKYKLASKQVDALYLEVLAINEISEIKLIRLLAKVIRIFKIFFVSTSPVYLSDDSIFSLAQDNVFINYQKFKKILDIDIHKSFTLIQEEAIRRFYQKSGAHRDYNYLAYLFTSYSRVPSKLEVQREIKENSPVELKESILHKNQRLKVNLKKYQKLYDSLNLQEKRLVNFIQMIKRVREDRKQYLSKLFFSLFCLSERLLSRWEIEGIRNGSIFAFELLRGKNYIMKHQAEILTRDKGYVFYCDREGYPTFKPFSGETDFILRKLEKTMVGRTNPKIIQGKSAYKGNVLGRVVVAIKNEDFKKITKNTILVTSMTRPEIVAYLKQVKAIITDEGGITCHAAIISREMKKPCIIGTKIATQVLHDGDLVLVDANKGRVKILVSS